MTISKLKRALGLALARHSLAVCATIIPVTSMAIEQVDIMVLYSSGAEENRNGAIDTYINQIISTTNTAYENSHMDVRIRLVHSQKLDLAGTEEVGSEGLSILQQNAQVAELRAKYGADLVALLNLSKRLDGGFVCGIAYVGFGTNGVFSRQSKNAGYSLSGADCGATTFSHELGHNMGLEHSRVQGDNGGMFPYALGYGVQNTFATIMAYDFLFNARGVERFSNPRIDDCAGLPCGVDLKQSDSADAALAVNLVADQIADFFPSQVPDTNEGGNDNTNDPIDNGDDENTDGTNDGEQGNTDPIQDIPSINGNLIENASFENNLTSWRSLFSSTITANNSKRSTGESSLHISNRSAYYSGAAQNLDGKLKNNQSYRISADLKLDGEGTDQGRMVIGVNDDNGTRYYNFERIGINGDTWTTLEGEFTLNTQGQVGAIFALFYGPSPEKSFYLDQVSIVSTNDIAIDDDEEDNAQTNVIANNDLERASTASWEEGFFGRIALTSNAISGQFSLVSSERRRWFDGPMQRITTQVSTGQTYELSASVRMTSGSDQIQARLYFLDDTGHNWLSFAEQTVGTQATTLNGEVLLNAVGEIKEARLHFFGPSRRNNFIIDNVVLEKK